MSRERRPFSCQRRFTTTVRLARALFWSVLATALVLALGGGARAESPAWSDAGYLVCARVKTLVPAGSLPPLAVCVQTPKTIACARPTNAVRCGPPPESAGEVLAGIELRLTTQEQQLLVDGGTVAVTGFTIRNQEPTRSARSAPITLGPAQAPDVVKVRGFGMLP